MTLTAWQYTALVRDVPQQTITVTVTGGGKTHSCTYTLAFTQDFAISVFPSSGVVVAGGSVSTTVTVSQLNGFSSTVSLSVSGLPSGATYSLSRTSGTPSFTSTLTITTAPTTPAGTYTITITGTGGGKTHSCTYTLTVNLRPSSITISCDPTDVVAYRHWQYDGTLISCNPATVSTTVTGTGSWEGGETGTVTIYFNGLGAYKTIPSFCISSGESFSAVLEWDVASLPIFAVNDDGVWQNIGGDIVANLNVPGHTNSSASCPFGIHVYDYWD
jgi:hypothetical protein